MKSFFCLFYLLTTLVVPAIAYGQDLTILAEDLPPYNFQENGELKGSSIAIVRELLDRLDSKATIRIMPWARAYRLAQTRPNVLLLSTVRSEERENLFHWVGPLSVTRMAFYARHDADIVVDTLDDARKVKAIGTYRDDIKEQFLLAQGFTNLDRSNDPSANLRKLLAGRIDLWLSFDLEASALARKNGIDPAALKKVFSLDLTEIYLAFSLETPADVVEQWRFAFEAMKRDGTFYTLSSSWLPDANIPRFETASMHAECPSALEIFTENAPPSSFLEDGRIRGVAVEIVEELKKRLGYACPVRLVPWARGYDLALNKENVALFAATRLPQREDLFQWVGPLYSQTWGFYARKGHDFHLTRLEDAKKVARIGVYRKDAKEQFLLDQGFTNLVSANNNEANPRHLISGTIDLWVSSDLKMPYFSRQAGVDPLGIELVLPFRKVDNYIIFSQGTPRSIVNAWQRALDGMKADGTYAGIFKNWTEIDWASEE